MTDETDETDETDLRTLATADALRASLRASADELAMASHHHHPGVMADVREAEYRGHRIEVRTTYSITVDGRPFDIHVVVDNDGRVFYHGLPTRDFPSVIELVQTALDAFPGDFVPGADRGDAHHSHDHGGGMAHRTEAG